MTQATPIKAIILDAFDTTLVLDKGHSKQNPFEEMLKDMGIENPTGTFSKDREMLLTQQTTFLDYLAHHATDLPAKEITSIIRKTDALFASQYQAYNPRPEWQDFIQQAHDQDITVCIASNLATPYKALIEDKLSAADHHAFSCDMGIMKPHAEFMLQCCDMMDVKPEEAIMISNNYASDIMGVRNAHLADAFWVSQENIKRHAEPNAKKINRLTDVFAFLPK